MRRVIPIVLITAVMLVGAFVTTADGSGRDLVRSKRVSEVAPKANGSKRASPTSVVVTSTTVVPTTSGPVASAPTTVGPSTTIMPAQTTQPGTTVPPVSGGGSSVVGDFYVSPSGSDSASGSADAPFKTIQKAASVVGGGQTVVVRDGVYTERSCGSSMVCIDRGGRFVAESQWGAKLDGRGAAANGFAVSADDVRIEGFEIMNLANSSGSSSGIELYEGGAGSQIVGNNIHDIGRICTTTTNGQVGIFVEVDDVTIERNYVHDVGRRTGSECGNPGYSGHETHDHGVYLNGGGGTRRGVAVRNNVFANFERGWAVQVYNGAMSGLDLSNNTFSTGNPAREQSMVVLYDVSLSGSQIRNNVFFDADGGVPLSTGGDLSISGTTIANNLTNGSALADTSLSGMSSNNIGVDPQLGPDLKPRSGSAAVDSGAALGSDSLAYGNTPRPQGGAWDIGAYEQ